MGDAPFITLLSAVPLLIVLAAIVATVVAWSERPAVRTGAAAFLIVVGAATALSGIGMLFSMAAGAAIGVLGLALLVAASATGRKD
jgi:hypothetical protein